MKKILIMMVTLLFVLTGCAGQTAETEMSEQTTETNQSVENGQAESVSEGLEEPKVSLTTTVYGDGQKAWYVVVDYGTEMDPDIRGWRQSRRR